VAKLSAELIIFRIFTISGLYIFKNLKEGAIFTHPNSRDSSALLFLT